MPVIFCNTGWMEYYNGIDGDSIQRGGSYNNDSIGHEVCNFTNARGKVYGYVQPTGRINIGKLGAKKGDEYVDGVTVIWTAGPDSGGTAVVGWYKNATVYRELQRISKPTKTHKNNEIEIYRISASASDVRLLPSCEREFMIPRAVKGGIGQSNIWYADNQESAELVDKVLLLIEHGSGQNRLPDVDSEAFGSEGNPRLVSHLRRERNSTIVKKKKIKVFAETGALCCEVCGFNFEKVYGRAGEKFCEVHHLTPLHKSDRNTETKLSELAVVCSNCHRIIHRMSPMPCISELKRLIVAQHSNSH
ncbi:HNH endonuclease [Pseudomonas coronafaciens]|uniref:HNH endonuclease n=1 Tax=Pseudomonas coronafaciens TaxID=53409 RepID=UPI003799C354